MRCAIMICLSLLAGTAPAESLVSEPHALVYYQIPFAGNAPDTRASFGVRVDRTVRDAGRDIDYRRLVAGPAVAELRFGASGMESLTFAGVDYLAQLRALNADAEQGEAGKEKDEADEDKLTMDKVMHSIPPGYFIGAGIGLLLIGTSAAD